MNLFKILTNVGGMTTLSRVLGFIRDTIIARVFGVGLATDAFFVAFKIPNLLRRISAEGAFTQAFIPILSEYKEKNKKFELKSTNNEITNLRSCDPALLKLLGIFGAPWLIYLSAPGFISIYSLVRSQIF